MFNARTGGRLKQKVLSSCIALVFLFSLVLPAFAQDATLYETEKDEQIAKGILYRQLERFTTGGWLKIHVIQADLSEPTLKVDTLMGSNVSNATNTLTGFAQAQGAVAAVNGDFFIPGKAVTPVGAVVKNGELITNPSQVNGMATLAMADDNLPFISYWSYSGEVVAPNGATMPLGGVNKPNDGMKLCMYNRFFNEKSPKDILQIPDLVEMVVEKDRVTDIRVGQPSVTIPADGYILAGRRAMGDFLTQNFQVGDVVNLHYQTSPDWSKFRLAMGTGAILVQNGQIPASFGHNITGYNPRTALGVSQDNKTLFLVAVDGRQQDSKGMTQEELAALLKQLGAYTAVNLDGGGSTEMVGRRLGESTVSVLNSPSDGIERRIPIGIGLFSTAPATPLAGLKIQTASPLVPLGGGRTFTVKGYDGNFNPVPVDPSQVSWSVTPGAGNFTGSRLVGIKPGPATVTAKVGTVSATMSVRILEKTVGLETNPARLTMKPGDKASFSAAAVDAQGYRAPVETGDIAAGLIGKLGTLQGLTLTAGSTPASGAVELRALGVKQRVLVNVSSPLQVINSFESIGTASFLGYPAAVTGAVALSGTSPAAHSGQNSLRLSYDFTGTDATRAAYISFGQKGLPLPAGTRSFGVWVWGDGGNGHWLRARLLDAAGKEYTVDLAAHVNWTGWKLVSADNPAGSKGPVSLSRIYLAETDPTERNYGQIVLDDLSVQINTPYREDLKIASAAMDPARKTAQKDAGSWQLAVFGDLNLTTSYSPTKGAFLKKVTDSLNRGSEDITVFAGNAISEPAAAAALKAKWLPLKKPYYTLETAPSSLNYKDAHLIFLNDSKGGLLASNSAQWTWLQQDLASAKAKNVFVMLPRPVSTFTDSKELALLQSLLSKYRENTGSNVWVFNGGQNTFTWELRDGVRYLGTPGTNLTAPAGGQLPHYLLLTIKSGVPSYQMVTVK